MKAQIPDPSLRLGPRRPDGDGEMSSTGSPEAGIVLCMTEPLRPHRAPIPTTRRREPAPSRNTGRGFARCWCAPGVRRATFSARRWTVRRSSTTFSRSAVRMIGPLRHRLRRRSHARLSDSGMPDSDANFTRLYRGRPPQGGGSSGRNPRATSPGGRHLSGGSGQYQHPDHLRVWDITSLRSNGLVTPYRPELSAAWSVSKIYYDVVGRILLAIRPFLISARSPTTSWFSVRQGRPDPTKIPIDGFTHVRRDGLLAHADRPGVVVLVRAS